ncbi:MAG: hypothetical protein ACXABY_12335 [Candidatus Thorarchaeota archaeon]|jgi:hypothetical protein
MTYLILLIATFGLLACVLAYVSALRSTLKLAILPVFLVSVVLGYDYYLDEIGKPAPIELPPEANYVAHRVTKDETILVWLTTEEGDRLYVIPYSREAAKELEEAKDKAEEGQKQSIKAEKEDGGGQALTTGDAVDLDKHSQTK